MKSFYITFHSESGDHIVMGTFASEAAPTKIELDALARRDLPGEIDGNTLYGRFEVNECGHAKFLPSGDPSATPLKRL